MLHIRSDKITRPLLTKKGSLYSSEPKRNINSHCHGTTPDNSGQAVTTVEIYFRTIIFLVEMKLPEVSV
jgi:hypothetical protein